MEKLKVFRFIPFLVSLAFTTSLLGFSLKEQMGDEAFTKAGLSKLSAEEMAVLEAWISGDYSSSLETETLDAVLPKGDDAFGYEDVKVKKPIPAPYQSPNEIRSTIEGKFKGWSGDEIFLLSNGQVWRQTDQDKFYMPLENPSITIKKGLIGTYFLSVDGYGSRCKVTRVR